MSDVRLKKDADEYLLLRSFDNVPAGFVPVDMASESATRTLVEDLARSDTNRQAISRWLEQNAGVRFTGYPTATAVRDSLVRELVRSRAQLVIRVAVPTLEPWAAPAPTPQEPSRSPTYQKVDESAKDYVEFKVVDDRTDAPIENVLLSVVIPGGSRRRVTTNANGLARIDGLVPGSCSCESVLSGRRLSEVLAPAASGAKAAGGSRAKAAGKPSPPPAGKPLAIATVEARKVRTGDTLISLGRACDLTGLQLAYFNWGTTAPSEINLHLHSDVGCAKTTADGHNYVFDDADNPGVVYLPTPWSLSGLPTNARHEVRVQAVTPQAKTNASIPLEEIFALIDNVVGPDTAFFGARQPGARTKIRKYPYQAHFSRPLSTDEKASAAKLEWAVQIEDSSGAVLVGPSVIGGKGEAIELDIIYDYAERNIRVGPFLGGRLHAKSKRTTVPFSVPLVAEIMDRLSTKLPVGIKTQRKWLDTDVPSVFLEGQSDLVKAYDTSLLKLAWVRGFPRGKAMYDSFVDRNHWFSGSLKKALLKRFQDHGMLGQPATVLWAGFPTGSAPLPRLPDPTADMRVFADCYEQHLAWKGTQGDPLDDLKAAIANCDWRMAFEGTLEPRDKDGKQLVTITKCAVFIRDSFDFVGDQPLGAWRAHPPDLQDWVLVASEYTNVNNDSYRRWRTENGMGYDYLIYSDVEYFAPSPAAQFRIAAAFFGGLTYEDV